MFDYKGDMNSAKFKSSLGDIGKKVSFRSLKKPELMVINGCAILWVVNWPTNGLVSNYSINCCDLLFDS